MKYQYYVLNDTTKVPYKRKQEGFEGQDSTAYRWQTEFASTKEVIQANQFLGHTSNLLPEFSQKQFCHMTKSMKSYLMIRLMP